MSIEKLPSGRWRAKVKSGRATVATKTFDLQRDAKSWHDGQKRLLDQGSWIDPKLGSMSLAATATEWMAARDGTVAGSTYDRDRDALARVPKTLSARPLGSLRCADFEAFYSQLLRVGLSRGSVMRIRTTLSALMTWAVGQGRIRANAVRESRVPSGAHTGATREVWPLSADELRAVHMAARAGAADKMAADMILVLGLTGLRWGEIAALRVRDVQLVPRPAFRVVRSRPDGQAVRNVTKGGKPRTVPLTEDVAAIVSALLSGRDPEAPLFPSETGTMRLLSNWRRAVKWSELGRGRRVHDLRHSAATIWLQTGMDIKTVQAWLGHQSAKLTLDTYAHWLGSDADASAIDRLNAALGGHAGSTAGNLGAGP